VARPRERTATRPDLSPPNAGRRRPGRSAGTKVTIGLVAIAVVVVVVFVAILVARQGGGSDGAAAAAPTSPLALGSGIVCAQGSISAHGGSTLTRPMARWTESYTRSCPGAGIGYQTVGSADGRRDFLAGRADLAGSDNPLSAADGDAGARCVGGRAVNLPVLAAPIAVVYNLPGVTGLRLSPSVLARIYSGEIRTWRNPAILADNPGADLPADAAIWAVHRADSSTDTAALTAYLAAAADDDWSHGSSVLWQASGGRGAIGNDGVASAVSQRRNSIGYVELSYTGAAGGQLAQLRNGAGAFVAASSAAGTAALNAATVPSGDDLVTRPDYRTDAPGAYPVYLLSYVSVCTKGLPAAKAALVRDFVAYAASAPGQTAVSGLGFAPLPDGLRQRVHEVASRLA
jgi:phosphate transport system substrate-binding protein